MKRLLLLVAALALLLGLALPVGMAGASPGPAKGLGAICEQVEGIELLANPRYDEVVPDGWACVLQ